MILTTLHHFLRFSPHFTLLIWILGVASKQLRLLHGRVADSTTVVNFLSPQMSELVEDAIASWCGDIVRNFWLVRNGVEKLAELKFDFFSFNTFDVSPIFWQRVVQPRPKNIFYDLTTLHLFNNFHHISPISIISPHFTLFYDLTILRQFLYELTTHYSFSWSHQTSPVSMISSPFTLFNDLTILRQFLWSHHTSPVSMISPHFNQIKRGWWIKTLVYSRKLLK